MATGAPFRKGSTLSEIQNSSIFSLDEITDEEMNNLIDGTVTDFDEGDLVTGTVVKLEHDEVLLVASGHASLPFRAVGSILRACVGAESAGF